MDPSNFLQSLRSCSFDLQGRSALENSCCHFTDILSLSVRLFHLNLFVSVIFVEWFLKLLFVGLLHLLFRQARLRFQRKNPFWESNVAHVVIYNQSSCICFLGAFRVQS